MQLREFDPSTMKDAANCLIIGKRHSGKSELAKDLVRSKPHLSHGIVMGNSFDYRFLKNASIHDEFDRDALVAFQKQRLSSQYRDLENAFVVLDDCAYGKVLKEIPVRQLFMNNWHMKVFTVLAMQYCAELTPPIRCCIDYVFVLKTVNTDRKRLYETFFSSIPSYEEFCRMLDACGDHECLVLDNTQREDYVFRYKLQSSSADTKATSRSP